MGIGEGYGLAREARRISERNNTEEEIPVRVIKQEPISMVKPPAAPAPSVNIKEIMKHIDEKFEELKGFIEQLHDEVVVEYKDKEILVYVPVVKRSGAKGDRWYTLTDGKIVNNVDVQKCIDEYERRTSESGKID